MAWANTDSATAALILQFQLDDIAALQSKDEGKAKGKEKERAGDRSCSDATIALTLYRLELRNVEQCRADERLARSMAAAVQADWGVLAACREEEAQAEEDRSLARRLEGRELGLGVDLDLDRCPEHVNANANANGCFEARRPRAEETVYDDEFLAHLCAAYVACMDPGAGIAVDHQDAGVEAVAVPGRPAVEWAKAGPSRGPLLSKTEEGYKVKAECAICTESLPEFTMLRPSCGHLLCRECVRKLFQRAITDESSFPPRCCGTIPLDVARTFLAPPVIAAFKKATLEYQTSNRFYCASALCSLFIPAGNVGDDLACCDPCGMLTCVHCKGEFHYGDCPEDGALQELLKTAASQGWKRCCECERMVELEQGCFHI